MKEVQFRPNIGEHDYQVKLTQIGAFLINHEVRVTVTMRGREKAHPELAIRLVERIRKDLADLITVPAIVPGYKQFDGGVSTTLRRKT